MKTQTSIFLLMMLMQWGFMEEVNAFTLTVLGGLSSVKPNLSSSIGANAFSGTSGESSPIGGIEVGFSILPKMELESGLLVVTRHFSFVTTSNNTVIDQSYSSVMVPLVLRFKPISFVSFGFGPYAMFGMGKINETDTIAGVQKSQTQLDFDNTSGLSYKSKEFGVLASIRGYIPILPMADIILDVRYLKGLSDVSGSPLYSDQFSHMQYLGGVSLGF